MQTDLGLAEVTIPGVERFKPDALKRRDEAELKKLAAWREKRGAVSAETEPVTAQAATGVVGVPPTRWKERKARGGLNGAAKAKQQEPPAPHDAAEEFADQEEEEYEGLVDAEPELEEQGGPEAEQGWQDTSSAQRDEQHSESYDDEAMLLVALRA